MLKEATAGDLFNQAGICGLSIKPEEFGLMQDWNNDLYISTLDQLLYHLQSGVEGIISPHVLLDFLKQLQAKAD